MRFTPTLPRPSAAAALFALALGVSAFAQTTSWNVINHGLTTFGAGVTGIAYGNGVWVVVGVPNREDSIRWATSTDGVAWTARSQNLADLRTFTNSRVRFLNGKFIFTGELTNAANTEVGSYVFSSADGLTWTRARIATGRHVFEEIDASPTLTIAAGSDGDQWGSPDLETWTARPVTNTGLFSYTDIAYGNGRWISTTNGGGASYTSPDGTTWTPIAALTTPGGFRAEFGNGLFFASGGGFHYTSTDGVTFTRVTTTGALVGASPRFAGGRFVSNVGSGFSVSSNGTAWTSFGTYPAPPFTQGLWIYRDVAFGDGKYIAALNNAVGGITNGPILVAADAPAAPSAPAITTQPAAANVIAGGSATFTVVASGTGNTYQWRKDNVAIAGATSASLTISNVAAANAGSYTVVVTNSVGSTTSATATLAIVTASNVGRLVNMSIRTTAGTGDNILIVGLGVGGPGTSGTKGVLIRGVGPTLASFGLSGVLADPIMTAFQGQAQVAQNDDWTGTFNFSSLGAFGFTGTPVRDAAIHNDAIPSGSYSIHIAGKNNATGIALAEIYDATPDTAFAATTPRLVNVSARTQVGTDDNILIAGFSIGGATPVRLMIRAVGPSLAGFGVPGTLADPRLEVYSGSTRIAENDNWAAADGAAFSSVGAFGLTAGSRDAVIVTSLQPGTYTAQVSGVNRTTGVALVEVYELP